MELSSREETATRKIQALRKGLPPAMKKLAEHRILSQLTVAEATNVVLFLAGQLKPLPSQAGQ
jgi:hypothetical protein